MRSQNGKIKKAIKWNERQIQKLTKQAERLNFRIVGHGDLIKRLNITLKEREKL
jgi:hypothetical protein